MCRDLQNSVVYYRQKNMRKKTHLMNCYISLLLRHMNTFVDRPNNLVVPGVHVVPYDMIVAVHSFV